MPQKRITPCLSVGGGMSEMALTLLGSGFTPRSDISWPMKVVESVRVNYHLQNPLLKEARPRDGARGYENS